MAVEGFAPLAGKPHRYESRYQLIWSIGAMAIFSIYHKLAMKKLTTTSGIVQTALFPGTVKSYWSIDRNFFLTSG